MAYVGHPWAMLILLLYLAVRAVRSRASRLHNNYGAAILPTSGLGSFKELYRRFASLRLKLS